MNEQAHIRNGLLLLRCQRGDGDAFAELVGRWQQRLWQHANRMTGSPEAAADLVQELWVAVVKGLDKLEDLDAFPAWVFTILSNKCRDWVRKQQRRRALSARLNVEARSNAGPSAATEERIHTLRDALQQLTIEQRALITLYYQEGFTTDEIGEIINIPRGTVKSRLYHARKRIRGLMEEMQHV